MRLYHLPRSRSTRVLWLLEETGAPYDLTLLTRDEKQAGEHRDRHPLGRVPVLEDDEGFLFESAALCLQIADLHPEAGLIPPIGTHERGLVYQWVIFSMTEIEPAVIDARSNDPDRAEAGAQRFQEAARTVEHALEGREFLVGGRFSVADLVCGAVLIFGRPGIGEALPNVAAYVAALEARPARSRAVAVGLP